MILSAEKGLSASKKDHLLLYKRVLHWENKKIYFADFKVYDL